MLWYAISIFLVILVLVSFYRITSFDAFVELKSSALRLEFSNEGPESEMVDFSAGATIVDAPGGLAGSYLQGISTLSRSAGMRLEALGPKPNAAKVCLQQGRYFVNVRDRKERGKELKVDVESEDGWCADVTIREQFLVFPRKVVVGPRVDSRGVETYPDMTGKLRIRNTDKELLFISGMTLHLLLEEKPATIIAFADGRFGMHAWKKIQVLWSDRDELVAYHFTPLDILKKYAGDNGLWFSISLVIGIVFGIRKLLLLR